MANKYTDEQLKAIETLDRSVLVSAAAGSGKTAVLIERIIRIICDGKAGVDEMLVVTFTKAAAAEMRQRLAKAIRNSMSEHPEDAKRMKEQLAGLYKAYISTINSFALRVIREFFHEIDIDPDFSMADEVQSELLKREAAAELLEEGFLHDDVIEGGSFRAFLRLYSEERSEEGFIDSMLKSYDGLRSMPDYFDWAFERAEQLNVDADSFEGSDLQRMMAEDAEEVFAGVLRAFSKIRELFDGAGLDGMYEKKLKQQEESCRDIYKGLKAGEFSIDLIGKIKNIPSVTLRASKDEKESYESIKSEVADIRKAFKRSIDEWKNAYLQPDLETRLAEMNATYEHTLYYLHLLEDFERRYDEKKRERRVMDFADTEHYAARILKKKEAAEVLRKRFKYIFVDEYQDTNNIQEYLISSIARPDNVFRVGDVKQSIYKFRQAEPEIFERLYDRYAAGKEENGAVIDLSRNFRTNDRTIRYINHVFGRIMDGYDERAMLRTGSRCPDEYDFMPEVHLLFTDVQDPDASDVEGDGGEDEDIEELSKEEAEAEYIAELASSIIGTEFYDTKKGELRRAEAKDIVILLRAVSRRGDIMSRALRGKSIESHVEASEDYFDTVEIGVALSLLMCIDNMKRDVPLLSALHSEVFAFEADELAEIRLSCTEYLRKNSAEALAARPAYWKAFGWYAKEGPEGRLKDKAAAAREKLLEWRRLSRMLPLEDFVWKVLVDSGYYRMAGAMSEGARRQANLKALADRAGKFRSENIASLSSFISFVELLKTKKINNGQASMAGSDDDVIRIMTIHKSKGLEFPFVIIGGLGHKFRTESNKKAFSFDSSLGVGLPYIDPSRKYWRSTLLQRAITSKSVHDGYKEELRLLYVAMTRARNKLYMVGTAKSEEDLLKYEARPHSFLSAMQDVVHSGLNKYRGTQMALTKSVAAAGGQNIAVLPRGGSLTEEEQLIYDEIDRRFSYSYPYEDQLTAKAKYSVSEVRREENKARNAAAEAAVLKTADDDSEDVEVRVMQADDEIVHLWKRTEKRKRASAADVGIAYHRIMEFLDFSKVTDADGRIDGSYIKERAEFLHTNSAIDDEVFASLELRRISDFFDSGLGKRALAAAAGGTLRREKPFTLKTVRSGREMLVQGVIDCCFEEDGRMVIIDYKSSFIRTDLPHDAAIEKIRDEYRVQLELYSEAVMKGTGKEVAEAYLWLFAASEAVRI